MILADLDALISACPAPAMIVLTEPDWRATMQDPAGAAWRQHHGDHVSYRGIPVWVEWPGQSRVLTAEQVREAGLDQL